MSRITINVDLETNEVFEKETIEAIRAEARKIAREQFSAVLEEEVSRLIGRRLETYSRSNKWDGTQAYFNKAVDEHLRQQLGKIQLSVDDIRGMVETKIRYIESDARGRTTNFIEGIDKRIDAIIDEKVMKWFQIAFSDAFTKAMMQNMPGGKP